MTRVLALVATIPPRRASCERLLKELAKQSRPPDGVILCLDGYGDFRTGPSAPACPLPLFVVRRQELSGGPGHKWGPVEKLAAAQTRLVLAPDCQTVRMDSRCILISIDDDADLSEAPRFIEALAVIVETTHCAAAAMGYTPDGHRAAPGPTSRGRLILGCGCGLAVRAGDLEHLQALADKVKAGGGPDALGPCGDDQALVSAHLWLRGVPLYHAAAGALSFAPGTQAGSQGRTRMARGEVVLHEGVPILSHEQAHAIARITGWPFPEPVVEVQEAPALAWEEELGAVPEGAVRARGAAPPAGHRRVLIVDGEEPERSGVYDVPT